MITVETLLANPGLRKGSNWKAVVTHCRKGHLYTRENTVITHCGTRECRTCKNERANERNRAKREAAG